MSEWVGASGLLHPWLPWGGADSLSKGSETRLRILSVDLIFSGQKQNSAPTSVSSSGADWPGDPEAQVHPSKASTLRAPTFWLRSRAPSLSHWRGWGRGYVDQPGQSLGGGPRG